MSDDGIAKEETSEVAPRLDRRGRPMRERKEAPDDVKLRSKILKIGESYLEELNQSIILTAGEINGQLQTYGDLIMETLPKAMSRLAHKSFMYGSLMTRVDPLLAKTVIEDVITTEMPNCFKRGDRMGSKACIRFLGCCWINGVLEEAVFIDILKKLVSTPTRLVALTCITTLPLLLKVKGNPVVEELFASMSEYLNTLDAVVPEKLAPFRKFNPETDTYIPCDQAKKDQYEKVDPDAEMAEDVAKEEEPKEAEASKTGVSGLFNDRPEFVMPNEDEYNDDVTQDEAIKKFEITELWNAYNNSKDTFEIKKMHEILKTKLVEEFTVKEAIIKEIDVDALKFESDYDIDQTYRCRLLKSQCFEDYDKDEFDYLLVYDMVSDILSRFSDTSFVASNQLFKLKIPGLAERIVFDVIISDFFQLPHIPAHHLHYISVCTIMERSFKRIGFILCPIMYQTMNLCIKKITRMDPEIRLRFETLFALVMNHLDFGFNFDVLKKITDPESEHFKAVQSMFNRLSIFTYTKKLEDILKENKMPEAWLTANFGDPIFVHSEDENDIKNISEKIKFKDESLEEFTTFIESDDIENKDSALEEFLFESVFRKANRNYSFMEKVLSHYSSILCSKLNSKTTATMLFNMFKHNIQRFLVFACLFLKHKIIKLNDLLDILSEKCQNDAKLKKDVFYVVQKLLDGYLKDSEKVKADEAVTVLKWVGGVTGTSVSQEAAKALLRRFREDLEIEKKWDTVKQAFEAAEGLSEVLA